MLQNSLLDYAALDRLAREKARTYQEAEPFPHICIDEFITPDLVRDLVAAFPEPDLDNGWRYRNTQTNQGLPAAQKKFGFSDVLTLAPVFQRLFFELTSAPILKFLESLTGIQGLIPDPLFVGGGLQKILPGGSLRVHADFNKHPQYLLDRRMNLLIYLNEDWQEEYGGHLELWSKDMQKCEHRFLPVAGRCIIFNTTHDSFHGHPDPLTCPDHRDRKSIALYYYTNGRPQNEYQERHMVLWQTRPGERAPAQAAN